VHDYSLNTKHEATRIMQRIDSSSCPVAVFVKRGAWRATKTSSNLYDEAMRKFQNELVGIYDKSAQIEWIQYDLFHAGVR
jgi:hypothetical protein